MCYICIKNIIFFTHYLIILTNKIIYYVSKKYKIKFQSNIGLIYGRDHFYYVKKSRKLCALIFFKT